LTPDIEHLREWIGRTQSATDTASIAPLKALSAVLDRDDTPLDMGDSIPPCWHWLYFLPTASQAELGVDGHPKRGRFLPPVPLPRRMWASSELSYESPLRVGQTLRRNSRITDVRIKEGRSGTLVFVDVQHEMMADDILSTTELQHIVYRELPSPGSVTQQSVDIGDEAPRDEQWSRRIEPTEVLLFRYSALTFNGHRIHYDRPYATKVEGYPGLVVHAQLIATFLLELLNHKLPGANINGFSFRAVKPLFDVAPFEVCGRMEDPQNASLWVRDARGYLAMEAKAKLSI